MMCDVLVGQVANREKEIADLKQQLHAYREYHDAREAYEREWDENTPKYRAQRYEKAKEALQILRNSK